MWNFETTEGVRTDSPASDWTRIASCAVGVRKLTSPSILVTSPAASFKGWRFTVFCCTVYPLAVCQKKEFQKELFGLRVFPSMAPRMRDEDFAFA